MNAHHLFCVPGYRPNRPGVDPDFPEFGVDTGPRPNPYSSYLGRPATPYNYHTGIFYGGVEDRYKYSENLSRVLGRKAGEIKEGEETS